MIRVITQYSIEYDCRLSRADLALCNSDGTGAEHFMLYCGDEDSIPDDKNLIVSAHDIISSRQDKQVMPLREVPGSETRYIEI